MAKQRLRYTRKPDLREAVGKPWRVTLLRAINDDGSLLWPDHDSLEVYQDIYESGGGPLFLSIWMQDPSGLAGDIFRPEWFQSYTHAGYAEEVPSTINPGRRVVMKADDLLGEGTVQKIIPDLRELISLQACDLALKQSETADFYARCNAYISRQGDLYLEDAHQGRYTEIEMVDEITRAGRRYKARAIGIESVSFQALVFRMATRGSQLPFVELDPQRYDKVIRARPVAARYQALKVYHLHGAPWRQKLEYQLMGFPGGAHDDLVDALAYVHELALKHTPGAARDLAETQKAMRRPSSELRVSSIVPRNV